MLRLALLCIFALTFTFVGGCQWISDEELDRRTAEGLEWTRFEKNVFHPAVRSGDCATLRMVVADQIEANKAGKLNRYWLHEHVQRAVGGCSTLAPELHVWLAENRPRLRAEHATPGDLRAWLAIARASDAHQQIVELAENARTSEQLRRWIRQDRWDRELVVNTLKLSDRTDLVNVIDADPVRATLDGVGDVASAAAGVVIGPVLGPFLAPR